MFSILMKPEATSSQAGEFTQLVGFPLRFLPSLLSEFVHYRQLVLSAITQIGFMRHAFIHSKSSFVGACVITWVLFQRNFLQLFVISIEVLSQITPFGKYRLTSVFSFTSVSCLWFLFISFRTFIFTLITLELLILLFLVMDFYDFRSYV